MEVKTNFNKNKNNFIFSIWKHILNSKRALHWEKTRVNNIKWAICNTSCCNTWSVIILVWAWRLCIYNKKLGFSVFMAWHIWYLKSGYCDLIGNICRGICVLLRSKKDQRFDVRRDLVKPSISETRDKQLWFNLYLIFCPFCIHV